MPALRAVVAAIQELGYDRLELLFDLANAYFVSGNHESYYVRGLPSPRPAWLSVGEAEHQMWTHDQLGSDWRHRLQVWPYKIEGKLCGVRFTVSHCGLSVTQGDFSPLMKEPNPEGLDRMFDSALGQIVFIAPSTSLLLVLRGAGQRLHRCECSCFAIFVR